MRQGIILWFITATLFCTGALQAQTPQTLDGIAAVVGDEVILISDVNTLLTQYAFQNKINIFEKKKRYKELSKQFLKRLIDEKLLLIKAKEDTIRASEERVDQILAQQVDRMLQQVGSKMKLEAYYGSPIPLIKKELRQQIENQLKIEQLRQMRFSNITISRREVETFYKNFQDSLPKMEPSVDISHLLRQITPSEARVKNANEKLTEIQKKLNAGEDFGKLAREHSQDPGSASSAGDLGWVQKGDLVKEFEAVAFSLKPGEISDIVQTPYGLHIIQLLEKKDTKIHVRHILLQISPSPEDEKATIAQLKSIRQDILSRKATFEEMALQYSTDPNAQKDKGHLGEFVIGNFKIPTFAKVLKNLKEGEISQPFKTEFGYHILKLNKRSTKRSLSLDNHWETIENFAKEYKISQKFQKWITELRNEIPVKIHTLSGKNS